MQWYPDEIFAEPGSFTPKVQSALQAMGYEIRGIRQMGDIAAIVVNPKTGMLESVNDPRYPAGAAAGY
jgi:gamma-glutamyltranspeptidase/glutathione hydrolase